MKLVDEKGVLEGLKEVVDTPLKLKRNNQIKSLIFLFISVTSVIFFYFYMKYGGSKFSYILLFLSGAFFVRSFNLFSESLLMEYLVKYLDVNKINKNYNELANKENKRVNKLNPFIKILLAIIAWIVIASLILYVIRS